MSLPLFVPDASVVLKWALCSPEEQDADRALKLLQNWLTGACNFLLPSLWLYEVGNVLGLKSSQTASEFMGIFIGYRFPECVMTEGICTLALDLMQKQGVTFYDAIYHAVAISNSGCLVTADAAYYKKAHSAGFIMMLDEYGGSGR